MSCLVLTDQISLYEDLSNRPKPTKKIETEREKVEKITDKLFEELNSIENVKKNKSSIKTLQT